MPIHHARPTIDQRSGHVTMACPVCGRAIERTGGPGTGASFRHVPIIRVGRPQTAGGRETTQ